MTEGIKRWEWIDDATGKGKSWLAASTLPT